MAKLSHSGLAPRGCHPLRANCVGPVTRKQASDGKTSGEPTGSSLPAQQAPLAPVREAPQSRVVSFRCDFPGCDREFGTKTGRGVHMRRAHPNWTDDLARVAPVKARWTDEEVSLLAQREAELSSRGVRFMNQELLGFLPGRSLEAIKGTRRRADYRAMVAERVARIEEGEVGDGRPADLPHCPANEECDQPLLDYFLSLAPLDTVEFRAQTLDEICCRVGRDDRGVILERLTAYLAEVFLTPETRSRSARPPRPPQPSPLSRRRQRRADFGRTQKLWRRNPGRCFRSLMGAPVVSRDIPRDVMIGYWESIMTDARGGRPLGARQDDVIPSLWSPVSPDEVRGSLPGRNTAPGPDGLSARVLHCTHVGVLCRIYNLILWCRRLPVHLRSARTVLVPKISEPVDPADYRPISVSSALVRGLHKVLARRMGRVIRLDERQRAFRATDGCADNVFLLDLVLRYHHERHRPLHVASVDVAKAFDTVSHDAILETLRSRGCPVPMLEYVEAL